VTKRLLFVLTLLAGCSGGYVAGSGAGQSAQASVPPTPAPPATAQPGAAEPRSVLLMGGLFPNPAARVGAPADLLVRLDEELRWAIFLEGVFRVPEFRGRVDFAPAYPSLNHLRLSLGNALEALDGANAKPEAEKRKAWEEVGREVRAARGFRLQASADIFQFLPTEVDRFQPDIDLLAGK
jgi:hypothetical protein